ncbi:hypothetical protein BDQ12DRAFT_659008, partial [Crucibulum laeve]
MQIPAKSPSMLQLLRTGYSPMAEEELHYKALRDTYARQWADIDAEINRLNKKKQKAVLAFSRTSTILSPIRRLPMEALQHIFHFCVLFDMTDELSCYDSRRAPLLLGHVCAWWRVVSLATPELWKIINILIQRSKTVQYSHRYHIIPLTTVLRRSGTYPLTFKITSLSSTIGIKSLTEVVDLLLHIVISHASIRLRHLHLNVPHSTCNMLHQPQLKFPALETFTLRTASDRQFNFGYTPRLRKLTI